MISSLNHHISILKLRIHSAYLEYMDSGILTSKPPPGEWCAPVVLRSRWYDLFNVEDRLEAMRGIWGVMSYLARETDEQPSEMKK